MHRKSCVQIAPGAYYLNPISLYITMAHNKDKYGNPIEKRTKNTCHEMANGDKKNRCRIININYTPDNPRLYNSCTCQNKPKLVKIENALRKKMKIRRQKLMKKRELEIAPMGL
jgi:hypothetical protein